MTLKSLRSKSNCRNPNMVLQNLINKYPFLKKYISLPGKKGRGGYSTTILLVGETHLSETI